MKSIDPYKSRAALIEAIANARALKLTADSTKELLHWLNRQNELQQKLDPMEDGEESQIEEMALATVKRYEFDRRPS